MSRRALRAAVGAAALSLPRTVCACAVCFGGANPEMARGFYWGVMLLMLLPFALMAALVGLVVHHTRKHRTAVPPAA